MKNKILILIILFMLLLMPSAYALQVSYMYVSLSYGRGWWPWVCVTEKGYEGYGTYWNSCGGRSCPFESAAMIGVTCLDYGALLASKCRNIKDDTEYYKCLTDLSNIKETIPPVWGLVVKITVPEDLKLVATSDETVVGDEVCVGDRIEVVKGVPKGEFWNDGGHEDSPPIYWVDDVEKVVDKIMDYHEKEAIIPEKVYSPDPVPSDGYVDPVAGIPVYSVLVYPPKMDPYYGFGGRLITGNMVCSLKKTGSSTSEGGFVYEVKEKKDLFLNETYAVECMYYYYGALIKDEDDYAAYGYYRQFLSEQSLKQLDHSHSWIYQVPMVIQAGPEANTGDWGTQNVYFRSKEDFFKIGEMGVTKTIHVVDPANPKLEVSVSGADKLSLDQPNYLRVLVRNVGDVEVELLDVSSKASYRFVSCDSRIVKPGGTVECLIEITPKVGEGVSVSVNYGYRSCGRVTNGVVSKEVISSQTVKASSMSQIYALDVSGGCVNRYYVCNSALEQEVFSLGCKCSKNEPNYVIYSVERIDLGFDLPALPRGATVAGARLGLTASNANKAQDVLVYSILPGSTVSCLPTGDICAQPYCSECKPLFDASGQQLGTTYVAGPGKYYIDVTDAVKQAYQNKDPKVFLQLRGKEDYSADIGSCGAGKDWTRYDLNFRGKTDAPYLEIVYAK